MKKRKTKDVMVNRDITQTIRSSYETELQLQTKTLTSLKKQLKTLTTQLSKAMSTRRQLKKKRQVIMKKAGFNPAAAMKKQLMQAKAVYEKAMEEVKNTQKAIVSVRQELRLTKEQVKKLHALTRSVSKLEKRWGKAIASKFKSQKRKTRRTKKRKSTAVGRSSEAQEVLPVREESSFEVDQG
ncbi:MAG: hypothetical protein A3F11_05095 [Gammaproteobacteria bacterium RIFCSPHIGHO2_12_FULL_37_14]|nr:MAG: hypothetical protein A3F11_05095 [Gammaproteobacteria bacterium RIFCSPHIGHO2_12_FULL_37_14]